MVNESSNDLLAGPRLAREKNGRLGMCDASGVRQHVLPLLRLTDDAPLTGAGFEFASQRGDLRFETEGAWKRSGTTVDSLAKELRLALQYPEGAAV